MPLVSPKRRTPVGAVIEILESRAAPSVGVVIPNEIRINGVSLLAPSDRPVTVHEMDITDGDVVSVTLTLFARRIIIGTEADVAAQPPIYGEGQFSVEALPGDADLPVAVECRRELGESLGAAVDHHAISIEQAERLVSELQAALAKAKADA